MTILPVSPEPSGVTKVATGIAGFDQISRGGLPRGRLTAIIGAPGAGKTVFAVQTLANRLATLAEPCIFVTFEETAARIRSNVSSFDWVAGTQDESRFVFVDARIPEDAIVAGAFDLEGLLAGLSALKDDIGARNIVFDGIDMLLGSLNEQRLERQELLRLDEWIRRSDLSAIVTVKTFSASDHDRIRSEFLQYMTDCLVILSETVTATGASRSIRVAKYRGAGFAPNPVPFVIGASGIDVIGFKDERIAYPVFGDRVSSGVARLDALLNGGYLRGSSTLISGSPGTSKSSLGAGFVAAACARGERALLVSFDESVAQIVANMASIGLDLRQHVESGRLRIVSFLSGGRNPEEHFVAIRDLIATHRPACLMIDPISALPAADYPFSAVVCEYLLDVAKAAGITVLCTSLLDQAVGNTELSDSKISTIADTWLHVSYVARDGERNRALTIVKSRGTGHSNQVRELVLSAAGIDLVDVYVAEGEVLMGSARAQKEAEAERMRVMADVAADRRKLDVERELAEAQRRVTAAGQELSWKRREADLIERAERSRVEAGRASALARLALRRVADDDRGQVTDRGGPAGTGDER